MQDDAELMHLTASGDESAFRTLVERYQGEIYNFFLRTADSEDDAADLTQRLFIKLFRSARGYRKSSSFRTFIFSIARNLLIDHYRQKNRADVVSIDEISDGGGEFEHGLHDDGPMEMIEALELNEAFVKAVRTLPDEWRIAMELRVGRQMSYKEIASVMGRSVSSVETIIFRARERLAEELKRFRE
ncbi:MAG: hypothetical protein B6D63_05095 [Candidatus Latescibacteria bacterium 4484_7]|nr:MAG: hypothetical protein B6D63_05095 [Candidatus Latescibacteria bacterium 4484_7]RKZ08986.1 MAG: hypothetical protein DRQ05_00545 [bacterium]